ncbi:hypothetical protein [Streptomyces sp. ITFR-16]|uniref:hypothetical protein n=1 Tax=Streptomyces sp. ITFR-16 TaxID=3075198 RepID=UPI00288A9871|nr:hypothetical protein [Streptomyces sp. ITFR-16]WNI22634.1 hypothetical protein RLT58_12160 [Streptomyces sp. ITFR-16]
MRSARTLFASAAVTAVLTITAPSAYAMASAGDWEHDSGSSSSSEDGGWKKDKPNGGVHTGGGALAKTVTEWQPGDEGGKYKDKDKPHGGVHTGGGALSMTVAKEWQPGKDDEGGKYKKDEDKPNGGVHTGGGALSQSVSKEWQPGSDEAGKTDSSSKSEDEGWKKDKPSGGMHTGGGAMAMTGSGLAAGSLLLLGGVGVGAYKLRRRQATGGALA